MRHTKQNGYTLGQLMATLCILTMTAFFVGVVLVFALEQMRFYHKDYCASNIKQIELGILQYTQDYDATFPPAAQPLKLESQPSKPINRVLSGWAVTHNIEGNTAILVVSGVGTMTAANLVENADPFAFAPLQPYVKNNEIFRCSEMPKNAGPLSYMLNDLAAGKAQKAFSYNAQTVLVCDSEDFGGNVGHAYDPALPPAPATFGPNGKVILGATLQTAPTRHSGGANYGFADGHVKWSKPEAIYFPSRLDGAASHKNARPNGSGGPIPVPGGDMHGFHGTFHIN